MNLIGISLPSIAIVPLSGSLSLTENTAGFASCASRNSFGSQAETIYSNQLSTSDEVFLVSIKIIIPTKL